MEATDPEFVTLSYKFGITGSHLILAAPKAIRQEVKEKAEATDPEFRTLCAKFGSEGSHLILAAPKAIRQEVVKESLPRGEFHIWIEAEFKMNYVTATQFMNIADKFGEQILTKLKFNSTVLRLLAAPSTPDEIIEKAPSKRHHLLK